MTWFKTLLVGIIDSWKELYDSFTAHFIAKKHQPTIMVILMGLRIRKKRPCGYNHQNVLAHTSYFIKPSQI